MGGFEHAFGQTLRRFCSAPEFVASRDYERVWVPLPGRADVPDIGRLVGGRRNAAENRSEGRLWPTFRGYP